MFSAQTILIVEDEPLIALDLADAVAELGGKVIGPLTTVREALGVLGRVIVAGAILDAKLADRDITPVALLLASSGVPLVVHSATGLPADVAARWPDLPVLTKPAAAQAVARRLLREMEKVRMKSAADLP
jgi:DNA-binding response OmpR family regulator